MIRLQRSGYRSRDLSTDITLGVTDGVDMSLWCYVYAAIVFTGALSVYLPVGILSALVGWIVVSLSVTLTSDEPVHVVNIDDQAVIILGSISLLMVGSMGDVAGTPRGLATLLVIMSATALGFSASCYLVGRHGLSRLFDLMPFPVVCGFMASIGWLLLDAGVALATDVYISRDFLADLAQGDRLVRLLIFVAGGLGLMWVLRKHQRFWTLPVGLLTIVGTYYVAAAALGLSPEAQRAGGWIFDVRPSEGGAFGMLATLTWADIHWEFIVSVIPHMLTIIFLAILYASMSLSALKVGSGSELSLAHEFKVLGVCNLGSAAVCSPISYTDVITSGLYRSFGASSRWLQITSCMVGVLVIGFGGGLVGHMPTVLVGSVIFLFTFQIFYDWLYETARGFDQGDHAVVWIVLGTTILAGFMAGILVGLILTVVLFVIRYGMISAIESRQTLRNQRSSVERSPSSNAVLTREGDRAVIYRLRGFLFFGSANAILDAIVEEERLAEGNVGCVLVDMKRVTGLDVSASQTFAQIRVLCDRHGVRLAFSGASDDVGAELERVGAVTVHNGVPLLFEDLDFAVEYLEDDVLRREVSEAGQGSIQEILGRLLRDDRAREPLLAALERIEIAADDCLFRQGDPDDGLYIVQHGTLSAYIDRHGDTPKRVKKFSSGSIIGELSPYLAQPSRTATVVANDDAVLYHLDPTRRAALGDASHELRASIHELVATTLAERVDFMNARLISQLD